jgi:hypothetical protein
MLQQEVGDSEAKVDIRPDGNLPDDIRGLDVVDSRPALNATNSNLSALFRDVVDEPLLGVADRYRRIGVSVARGTILKEELFLRGFVRTVRIRLGDSSFLALVPTTLGLTALGGETSWPTIDERAGPEHEFWKGWLYRALRALGHSVHSEVVLTNGRRVDLVVEIGGEAYGIEVETGSSDASVKLATPLSPLKGLAFVATTHKYATELASSIPGDMPFLVASAPELASKREALRMFVEGMP